MTSARHRLAAEQAALVRALLADGPPPSGFPEDRLRVEADVLRRKRIRLIAYLRPDLPEHLGSRYTELCTRYTATHPKSATTRSREDADTFATWLTAHGHLPRPKRRWKLFSRRPTH